MAELALNNNHSITQFIHSILNIYRLKMQRPNTAMPKSASSNSVKKEFALEVDDDQMSQPEMPNLYQYDLDELFQPVELPTTA